MRPIRPEGLAAEYVGRWTICRDGTHDEWVAEPRRPAHGAGKKATANDIDQFTVAES